MSFGDRVGHVGVHGVSHGIGQKYRVGLIILILIINIITTSNRNCPLPDTIEQGEAFSKEGGGLAFFRFVIIIIIFHRKESCLHLFNPKSWSLILDTLTPNLLTQYFDA